MKMQIENRIAGISFLHPSAAIQVDAAEKESQDPELAAAEEEMSWSEQQTT